MGAYVTRRILTSIPTLLVIVTVAFFMMRIAPGGPFDQDRALPPEIGCLGAPPRLTPTSSSGPSPPPATTTGND